MVLQSINVVLEKCIGIDPIEKGWKSCFHLYECIYDETSIVGVFFFMCLFIVNLPFTHCFFCGCHILWNSHHIISYIIYIQRHINRPQFGVHILRWIFLQFYSYSYCFSVSFLRFACCFLNNITLQEDCGCVLTIPHMRWFWYVFYMETYKCVI